MGDINLRDPLPQFVEDMERVLRENDSKGGWEGCTFEYLLCRLYEEIDEVETALISRESAEKIRRECVDVANFAMMIYDNIGKL